MIRFGSYCAGIEAASLAVERAGLDWSPAFLSEIAPFQREVLRVRQGAEDAERPRAGLGPMLWRDFTALRVRHLRRFGVDLPDMICGGTPCQAFSFAGARRSLADARGNLTLEFVKQAHAIDQARAHAGRPGLVLVWENVPGVLNTPDNAFGCFLGGTVGADCAVEGLPNAKPGEPERFGKWPDAGMVEGPRARAAWRLLDAQHFGLAQRRARVFVVVGFRGRFDPSAVLFEPKGVSGNSAARREAGEGVAVSPTLRARANSSRRADSQAYVPDISPALKARDFKGPSSDGDGDGAPLVAHTLRGEGFDASEDGTGRGTPIVPICFGSKEHGADATLDLSPTLRAGAPPAIAFALRGREGGAMPELSGEAVSAVRLLTPEECAALQGFPRSYTAISWRGRPADQCPDGPRYMSLGNSWAVDVVAWIFSRLDAEMKRAPARAVAA